MQGGVEDVDRRNRRVLTLLSKVFSTHYEVPAVKGCELVTSVLWLTRRYLHMQRHSTLLTADCICGIWATLSNSGRTENWKKSTSLFRPPAALLMSPLEDISKWTWLLRERMQGYCRGATEGLGLYLLIPLFLKDAPMGHTAQFTSLLSFKVCQKYTIPRLENIGAGKATSQAKAHMVAERIYDFILKRFV